MLPVASVDWMDDMLVVHGEEKEVKNRVKDDRLFAAMEEKRSK